MSQKRFFKITAGSFYKLAAGVLFFCLFVFLLNSLLGFLNLEKYDKEFNPRSSYPIFVPGDGDQAQNFEVSPHFGYSLNYQTFTKKKAADTIRVFVIGGSAAFAWPYTEQYGFTGYLRRVFDQFFPGKFEIINAAGMSYGSHRVYDVLQDVILHDPDLVIVYSGNNEYVERNVIAGLAKEEGMFDSVGAVLGQTHLYRATRLVLFRLAPSFFQRKMKHDFTDLRADSVVSRGSIGRNPQVDMEVLDNFHNNIKAMKDLLAAAGVNGIFCTVPSNVAGWHPDSTFPKFDNDEQAASWEKMQNEVMDALAQSKLNDADQNVLLLRERDLLTEMVRLAPGHQATHYLLGQVLMRLGEFDSAYQEFLKAKDLDARPVRALTSFNAVIRTMINENSSKSELILADLEDLLASEVRRGAPNGIFLDYCHLTEDAHKFVAIFMLSHIQKIIGLDFPLEQMSESIYLDKWGVRNKEANVLANEYFAMGGTYYHNGLYVEAEDAYLQVLKSSLETSGPFISDVFNNLRMTYQALGDRKRSREMLFKSFDAYPDNQSTLIGLGYLFLEEDQNFEKSNEMFRKAIQLNPLSSLAFEGLGLVAMQKGAFQEAIIHYEQSLRLFAENPKLLKNLGKAYFSTGEKEKAIHAWQNAWALDPSDPETWDLLKKYAPEQ